MSNPHSSTSLGAMGMVASTCLLLAVAGCAKPVDNATANNQSIDNREPSDAAARVGNVMGNALGTDDKGKSDIGKAIDNVTDAGARIEQHDKATANSSGTPDASDMQQAMGAAGGLLGAIGHSLGGAHRHTPVDFRTLETLLPSSLPDMQRGTPEGSANQVMGIKASSASVDFSGSGAARIDVAIKDATSVSALAGFAQMTQTTDSQSGDNYEKNETIDGRSTHATWDAQRRHGQLSLIVAKRYGVDVTGDNVDMAALRDALSRVDLRKLESMKDANLQTQ